MTQHPFVGLAAASAMSVLAHGFAYASLGLGPKSLHEVPASHVSFRVHDVAPPPPVPPKLPEVVPPAPPARVEKAKPKALPSVNPEPVAPPPPAAVDLRGVTLTNDAGGAAWSSAVGNGKALDGPVGPVGARAPVPVSPVASARGPVTPVAVVPVVDAQDLSSRPVPPELAGALRERYPAAAKQRGIGGSASVQARIEPDGRVRQVLVESESFAGFGDACKKTLLGSAWSAPRDRAGQKVATRVRYTCRFVVGP